MPYLTEIVRILLYICLLGMALLAVIYLRQRRLSWTAYCAWGLLAVLLPAIGPFLVILAHPECPTEVLELSDFAGSTAAMNDYVMSRKPRQVVLITECSMADNVQNPSLPP